MTSYLMDDEILQGTILPAEMISLSDADVNSAIAISQQASTEANQWQTYLNALALFGIEEWFRERSPQFNLDSEWLQQNRSPSIVQPESVATLEAQQFRLFLVAAEDLADEIAIPRSIVDAGQPHFYLLVEVVEELSQVRIIQCLRQDQLLHHQRSSQLVVEEDCYLLPIHWFSDSPGQLLLYLQHLEPAAFSVAFEEAAPAIDPLGETAASLVPPAIASGIQSAVNTGRWIRDWMGEQIDRVAGELAWILLPPATSSEVRSNRSPADQLDLVMSQLVARNRIQLPPQIGNAYQDISLAGTTLRLYAVTWELTDAANEWVLVLIIGTPSNTPLPAGLRFQLRDEIQLLTEQVVVPRTQDNFLFAQVRGELGEEFSVTLMLDGQTLVLPPLTFNPESSL